MKFDKNDIIFAHICNPRGQLLDVFVELKKGSNNFKDFVKTREVRNSNELDKIILTVFFNINFDNSIDIVKVQAKKKNERVTFITEEESKSLEEAIQEAIIYRMNMEPRDFLLYSTARCGWPDINLKYDVTKEEVMNLAIYNELLMPRQRKIKDTYDSIINRYKRYKDSMCEVKYGENFRFYNNLRTTLIKIVEKNYKKFKDELNNSDIEVLDDINWNDKKAKLYLVDKAENHIFDLIEDLKGAARLTRILPEPGTKEFYDELEKGNFLKEKIDDAIYYAFIDFKTELSDQASLLGIKD